MPLLFENYSLAELAYFRNRLNKTNSFLGNTKKTDRNGVSEQTQKKKKLESVSKDENK